MPRARRARQHLPRRPDRRGGARGAARGPARCGQRRSTSSRTSRRRSALLRGCRTSCSRRTSAGSAKRSVARHDRAGHGPRARRARAGAPPLAALANPDVLASRARRDDGCSRCARPTRARWSARSRWPARRRWTRRARGRRAARPRRWRTCRPTGARRSSSAPPTAIDADAGELAPHHHGRAGQAPRRGRRRGRADRRASCGCAPRRRAGSAARCCRWTPRAVGVGPLRLHAPAADRRGRGDHAVQLPRDPRHPQDRAGARGRQRRSCSSRRAPRRSPRASSSSASSRAGLPDGALQLVAGPGAELGAALCADPRVRKISFTGSYEAGAAIARAAGVKRLTCELGSNAALVVLDDADLDRAAGADRVQRLHERRPELRLDPAGARRRAGRRRAARTAAAARRRARPGRPGAAVHVALARDRRAQRGARRALARRRRGDAGGQVVRGGERDGAVVAPGVVLDPPRGLRGSGARSCSGPPSRSGRSPATTRRWRGRTPRATASP